MNETVRILIVEDVPTDAELAMREIRRAIKDCVFQRVETEPDYLHALEEFEPDLILSDYHLPHFTGMQALQLALANAPQTPVIVFTGSLSEDVAVECMKAGAANYVIKENVKRLGVAVVRALEEKAVRVRHEMVEVERREMEARYHRALDDMMEGCQIIDYDWRYVYVNASAARERHQTAEALLMHTMMEVSPGIENTELFRALQLTMESRVPQSIESQFTFGDGTLGWFDFRIQPVPEGIFILSIDITQRRESEQALTKSRDDYLQLFNNANDVILVFEPEQEIILQANAAACAIYGFEHDELVGMSLRALTKDVQHGAVHIRKFLEGGLQNNFESIHFNKKGEDIHFLINCSLIEYEGKQAILSINRDVTERRQAEEKLRQSEEKFKKAFYTSPDSVNINRLEDGLYVSINNGFTRIMGYTEEDSIGKTSLELDIWDNPQDRRALVASLKRDGEVRDLEARFRAKDGSIVDGLMSAAIVDLNSTPHIISMTRDITERKHAEAALRESVNIFQGFLDQSQDAVMLTDEQGIVTQWSRGAEELTGYSRDETIGKALWDVQFRSMPREHRGEEHYLNLKAALQAALLTGEGAFLNRLVESLLERPDGYRLTVQTSAFSIRTQKGYLMGGILRDMSQHKQAEEKLEQDRILLRTLIDNLPRRVYALDGEGRKIVSNEADWRSAGAKQMEEVLGKTDLDTYPGELGQQYWASDQEVLETGKAIIDHEEQGVDAQGKPVWVLTSKIPLRDGSGKISGLVGFGRDVTERKQAELLQNAVYRIASAAVTDGSLDDLYAEIHHIISAVMDAENFFITIYDAERDILTFPYFKDASDEAYLTEVHPGKGLTAYVLRTGKSLLCTQAVHDELERLGEVKLLGAPSSIWLGVPLIVQGKAIGAMVVQHYSDPAAYGEREQHMLEYVSAQVATAIHRKQAEQAVLESERRFRALIENSSDAITLLDKQGRVLYDSPSAPGLLGYGAKDWVGQQVFSLIHPDDLPGLRNLFAAINQTPGARANGTFRLQHKSGCWLWIEGVATNLLEQPGVSAIVVNYRDVTVRRQAEEALREREARYQGLFEDSPSSLWEEDFSAVKQRLDQLRQDGVTNFEEYLAGHPEVVSECAALVRVLDVNKATMVLQGAKRKEDLLNGIGGALEGVPLESFRNELVWIASGKTSFDWNGFNKALDGRLLNISMKWSAAPGYEDSLARVIVSMLDITERKRAEAERQALLEIMQALALSDSLPEFLEEMRQSLGKVLYAENLFVVLYDASTGLFNPIFAADKFDPIMLPSKLEKGISSYVIRTAEPLLVTRAKFDELVERGELELIGTPAAAWLGAPLLASAGPIGVIAIQNYEDPGSYSERDRSFLASVAAQVSLAIARKQAQEKLRQSEERFRRYFELGLIGMAITSPTKGLLEVNDEICTMLGYERDELLGATWSELTHPDDLTADAQQFQRVLDGEIDGYTLEKRWIRKDHIIVDSSISVQCLRHPDGSVDYFVALVEDITERKRAEAERRALLEIMQAVALTDDLPEFLAQVRESLMRVIDSRNFFVVFHDKRNGLFEEVFGVDEYDVPMPPSMLEKSITSYVFRSGEPLLLTDAKFDELRERDEVELVGKDSASWLGAPIKTPTETIGVMAVQNYEDPNCYSERDKAFLASVAAQVALAIERKQTQEHLRQSEARFAEAFHSNPAAVVITSLRDGGIEDVNESFLQLIGYGRAEVLGKSPHELRMYANPAEFEQITKHLAEFGFVANAETTIRSKLGEISHVMLSVVLIELNEQSFSLSTLVDITARKYAEANTQKQLRRLSALRAIDSAISSSFDLRFTLNVLLEHATAQLGVDAAAVLLLNRNSEELEYTAGRGFLGPGITKVRLKVGDDYAGKAVLERRIISIPDLGEAERPLAKAALLRDEKFVSFHTVPLVAKGSVQGVLEVFHRSRLMPDPEWMDFLETLAGQAALAIDNAHLFSDLQRSNMELSLAYDATIEGWSQAMDLRDKETEGHTQRVKEGALRLGRAMHLSEPELTQLRRGALLHDIGKMGVPDAILLKPGPLTAEEWVVMRQHPTFAYKMLAPIRYLQPALNIPYCHHEKWDGTGYPRELKGEQIPMSARIFAVIDVYDALTSDRPYRAAWSAQKARDYILAESGKHFDPQVVQVFLKLFAPEGEQNIDFRL